MLRIAQARPEGNHGERTSRPVPEYAMRAIHRILVAIKDPTARAFPALDKAIQLARRSGARIELFHAIASHVYTSFGLEDRQLVEIRKARIAQALARLEALAQKGREQQVEVRTAAEWDFPAHEAIVRHAARTHADLIVAECHAGRRAPSLFLHLTDWELLRASQVPVLLVKNRKPYARPVVLAAVDPTHANAKPTRLDDEILSAAVAIRQTLRGSLHVLHAYVPTPGDVQPEELLDRDATKKIEARARANARARLDRILKRTEIARSHRHVLAQHPVNAIPDLAQDIGSDIVVMGAVSRRGLRRLLIGNTAERVIDDLGCDVLVIKPKDFAARMAQPRGRKRPTVERLAS
jgi:universal stress protein E